MAPVRGGPAASRLPAPRELRGSPRPSPGRGRALLPVCGRLKAPQRLRLPLLSLLPREPREELGVLASASGAERRRRRRLNRTIAM